MSQASTARKANSGSNPARGARGAIKRRRAGKPWSGADLMRLRALADHQIPAERIALKLGRTEAAVRAEAAKQRVMLAPAGSPQSRPTQKRPYGGRSMAGGGANSDAKLPKPKTPAASRNRSRPVQAETLF